MTENRPASQTSSRAWIWIIPVLILLSIWLRVISLPATNGDVRAFLLRWYTYIARNGGFKALAVPFSNYNVPYLYLMWVATLFKSIPALTAIKLISILADLVSAYLVLQILRRVTHSTMIPWLGFCLVLVAPTVWINSAYWGQCDGIYTAALLASLLALLDERPYLAVFWFGLAFTFKVQTVFFAPLLLVLILKGKLPWRALGLILAVYLLMDIPALLAGRSWSNLLTIYLNQAGEYNFLSMNAPNFYAFISNNLYDTLKWPGIIFAAVVLFGFVILAVRSKTPINAHWLLLSAAFYLFMAPYLLPKMHERYFYPSAVFLIPLMLADYKYIPAAILLQITSVLSYTIFLLHTSSTNLFVAAWLNFIPLIFLIWAYLRELYPRKISLPADPHSG